MIFWLFCGSLSNYVVGKFKTLQILEMDSNNQIVELMAPLTISSNILLDDERSVVVYTDGAFFPNERLMGIGVWFGPDHNL